MTNYLYPYMQGYADERGGNMPKKALEFEEYGLQERYLWFKGNEDLLAGFYHSRQPKYSLIDTRKSFYYANVNSKIRVVHSGMPSLISYGKTDLLLSAGMEQNVVNNEDIDKTQTELLNDILTDNAWDKLISDAVTTESWAGGFAFKIGVDLEITKYPIVEMYNPMDYEAIYKRGRLQEIIFKNCIKEDYELHEHYGWGYIKYELFMMSMGKLVPVALDDIEETQDLEDVVFSDNMMLAAIKEVGKSDYSGIIAEFDSLDEAWSQLMDEIRTGRAETYIPEDLCKNKVFDDFTKKYVEIGMDMREGIDNKIQHNQPNIRSDEYVNTINTITMNILANVKLNPLTIGMDDNVGANSSGSAIEKRETVSLRTRSNMIKAYEPFLERFFNLLLNANNWINSQNYEPYNVVVTFGTYITPSIESKIDNIVKLKNADIIDDEKALDEVYEDMSDEEKERILANLGNITLDME